ncbi:inositol monophosphatase family protein [Chloroflexota bacterium]
MNASGSRPFLENDSSLLLSMEEHATRLARQAGSLLQDLFHRKLHVEYKSRGHQDPVTEVDRHAEELLRAGIRRQFPQHGILSEETPEPHSEKGDFVWVVDPLDGTTNFVNHYPIFGVSIGVLYHGTPVVGALFISSPLTPEGQVVHARWGGGAFADEAPIQVYGDKEPSRSGLLAMPAYFWSHFRLGRELTHKLGEVRITGSIVHELALVASGVLQYATFSGPRIWDVAAGVLIIREAGGEVLVHTTRRRWEPLLSFLEPATGLPADGDLRKWRASLLVGNPSVVDLVASNLQPRGRLWRWLCLLRARGWVRSRARERPAADQAGERPDAAAVSLPGGEGPPPPRA